MAPETYYFFFSILAMFAACLYITTAVYYRIKGKTIIGNSYKPGTIAYEKLHTAYSNRSLAIGIVVALLSMANLVFDIYRLLHLANQDYASFTLVFAPVSVIVVGMAVFIRLRNRFGNGKLKKRVTQAR